MDKFLKTLRTDVEEAIKNEAKEIIKEVGGEHIYAVALVLDSDCISAYMGVNTKEYLEKADRECFEMLKEDFSEEVLRKYEDGNAILTKWTPDEWGYGGGSESKFVDISSKLFEMEKKAPEEFENRKNEIIDIFIDTFSKVIQMNYFDNESVTFFVSMVDDDGCDGLELDSSKKLNSDRLHNIFIKERAEVI